MHQYITQLQIISFKQEMSTPLTWFPLMKLAKFPRVAFLLRMRPLKSTHQRFLAPFTHSEYNLHSPSPFGSL